MCPHEAEKAVVGETTRLLDSVPGDEELAERDWSSSAKRTSAWKEELSALIELSVPVIGTYLLEMFPGITSIILVGHIHHEQTEEFIDATALAVMFRNCVAISVGVGLTSALDTLCSQAYGANETHRMGTYLQTGVLVLSAFTVLVAVLFYFCEEILIALGQPEEVAKMTGTFSRILLPGIPALYLYELLRKVLQAQNVANPMLIVSIAANVVNVVLGYFLVFHTAWGWLGAAVARTASDMTFFLLLLPYTVGSGLSTTFWTGIHWKEAVEGITQFLTLGIPGMLQVCFEWWAFEVLALICGLLPNAVVSIGANAVVLNIASMAFMPYYGLSVGCNVRVGNALGASDPERAKLAAYLSLGLAAATAVVCATLLLTFRKSIPRWLTHDEEINQLSAELLIVVAVFQLPDAINGTVQGIFRGSGRQALGAQLNFVAYYLLGLPFAFLLAFWLHQGVAGLWEGMTVGLLLVAVVGTILVKRSDWVLLAKQATERIEEEGLQKD
ncbi:Protein DETOXIFICATION [Seminavis robusta]|uniref:Protein DETOXIFICATION n=1 Tax=Seminavis robusta TaxID=568900 RepID=A0A9N8H2U9_9STRA|nr:Protein DETOXIFICATION [Seminavis robusta]|eukprot:Sro15_g011090.1 Protein DETOXIFICATION (500) ;mRNA; f:68808-70307